MNQCLQTIADYGLRSIGIGERLLPRTDFTLCQQFTLIGSGLICAELGLPNALHESHASYVEHWLGILRGDKTAIIHAAAKAEQAFAYLRGFGDEATAEAEDVAERLAA